MLKSKLKYPRPKSGRMKSPRRKLGRLKSRQKFGMLKSKLKNILDENLEA